MREVSIGVNQVEFNMENLALLTGNTFTRPPRPDSPLFYGVCGPLPLATPASIVKRDGPCATSGITLWSEGLIVGTPDAASSLRESLDQGIPLPPLPRYPEWYLPRAPLTPSPTSSATEPWETSTQMSSPLLRSSSPPKSGAGLSSKSRRPSPYACQTCVPRDPAQRIRMQAKNLLRRHVEESEDPFLVMAVSLGARGHLPSGYIVSLL